MISGVPKMKSSTNVTQEFGRGQLQWLSVLYLLLPVCQCQFEKQNTLAEYFNYPFTLCACVQNTHLVCLNIDLIVIFTSFSDDIAVVSKEHIVIAFCLPPSLISWLKTVWIMQSALGESCPVLKDNNKKETAVLGVAQGKD